MRRRVYDDELYAHFVTFTCHGRRRHLDHQRCKQIVIGTLGSQLRPQNGICVGFVVMPDHVHALVWFPQPKQLSYFVQQWKQRSSVLIKNTITAQLPAYAAKISMDGPIWQPRYHPFHIFTERKLREKLDYMHLNPVRAGLVERPEDWAWSSARHYILGRSVGIPIAWPPGLLGDE